MGFFGDTFDTFQTFLEENRNLFFFGGGSLQNPDAPPIFEPEFKVKTDPLRIEIRRGQKRGFAMPHELTGPVAPQSFPGAGFFQQGDTARIGDLLGPVSERLPGLPMISAANARALIKSAGGTGAIIEQMGKRYLIDPFGELVAQVRKSKRMNVLNPGALKRAHRRVDGFQDFVMKNFSIIKKAKIKPKKRKRKR